MSRTLAKPQVRRSGPERGMALVLVLLIVVLLYILVAEVVTTSSFDVMTSQNQAQETGIRAALRLALTKAKEELTDDSSGSGSGGAGGAGGGLGGAGGAGGGLGNLGGAGGAGGTGEGAGAGGGQQEEEQGDSSRDAWFRPKSIYDDNKISVYCWIEDENRKFNLLNLISPDEDYAELSRQRLMRILDKIWEDTDEDLSGSEAESMANDIRDWMKGSGRNDDRPGAPVKRRDNGESESRFSRQERFEPLSLDELLLLPRIGRDMLADRLVDDRILPGLESVLTVYTSLATDPGTGTGSGTGSGGAGANAGGNGAAGGGNGLPTSGQNGGAGNGNGLPGGGPAGGGGQLTILEPGPRININTASRTVLRALEDAADIPDTVIEALIRYRNEVDKDAQSAAEDQNSERDTDELLSGDLEDKLQYYPSLDKLSEVKEFDNLAESEAKQRFLAMLTTSSHVFTIHLAALYKRDDMGRSFSITRAKAIVVRIPDGENQTVQELVPLHRTGTLRIRIDDYSEEERARFVENKQKDLLDDFSQEELAWNPFLREFFDPEQRDEARAR
ncbi:MAG: general secretion pathway protein GspK [Planctomycetes bacterium]|nr:general secretion pathway protein GspK [Planctomycetota bacterium]